MGSDGQVVLGQAQRPDDAGLLCGGHSRPPRHLASPRRSRRSTGDRVPVNLSIHYISFSAHSDYAQTSHFIKQLTPAHVVLVHGAEDLMTTLQRELCATMTSSRWTS